jgi:hypothetical protein
VERNRQFRPDARWDMASNSIQYYRVHTDSPPFRLESVPPAVIWVDVRVFDVWRPNPLGQSSADIGRRDRRSFPMLSVAVADCLRHFVVVEHRLGQSKSTSEVKEALFDQVLMQRHIAICFAFLTARFRCDVNAPMSVHGPYVLASQLRDFRNASRYRRKAKAPSAWRPRPFAIPALPSAGAKREGGAAFPFSRTNRSSRQARTWSLLTRERS